MDRRDVIWCMAATALTVVLLAALLAWWTARQAPARACPARTPVVVYDRPWTGGRAWR